ncbi:MAG: ATP-binding protein [Anaerolineae bacterium]|nr:ATP-binding protein [Anaerolineae bacterium]
MRELALHLLDIAENSVAAGARNVTITIEEDTRGDRIRLAVEDDGKGMDAEMAERVTDPFVTSRTTRRVGLGIPLLKAAAEACNGSLQIVSAPGRGTRVEVDFQRSHVDRMPLGDVVSTMLTLLVGFPDVHWTFHYKGDEKQFTFDDAPIKDALGEVPLTEPSVLAFVRETLETGISEIQEALTERELTTRVCQNYVLKEGR